MIFSNLKINDNEPIYLQLINHIINNINEGVLKKDSKLPSTREVSNVLKISRNSVIAAYEELESRGIIATKRGIGTFVLIEKENKNNEYNVDYLERINLYGDTLRTLDIIKGEFPYKKDMISLDRKSVV